MERHKPGTAFTLVEFLVCIGIIAGLTGLLLPAVVAARQHGLMVKCLANERSIAQAAIIQSSTHGGFIQVAGDLWGVTTATPANLGDADMRRYAYYNEGGTMRPMPFFAACGEALNVHLDTSSRVALEASLTAGPAVAAFTCPAQSAYTPGITLMETSGWEAPAEVSGYAPNEEVMGFRYWGTNTPRGRLSRIRFPTTVMLFADCRPRACADPLLDIWGPFTTTSTLADYADYESWVQYHGLDYARHNGHVNVAFADGHAETFEMGSEDRMLRGTLNRIGVSKGVYIGW